MVVDNDGKTTKARRGGDWNGEYYYDEYCHCHDDGLGGGMTTIVDATMNSRCDLCLDLPGVPDHDDEHPVLVVII